MILLLASAWAGTIALHDGADPAAARRVVARTLGLPLVDVASATLPQLLVGRTAPVVSGAQVGQCHEPGRRVGNDAIASLVDDAEILVETMDYERAATSLELALSLVACLSEPPDPVKLARAYYLRGVAEYPAYYAWKLDGSAAEGAEEAGRVLARVEKGFRDARGLRPDLAWDERFNDVNGSELFRSIAAAPVLRVDLTVLAEPGVPIWLDGASWVDRQPGVSAGLHVLQFQDPSAPAGALTTLTLETSGERAAVVLIQSAISERAVQWVFGADTQGPSGRVLADVTPPRDVLVAVGPRSVARLDPIQRTWTVSPVRRFPRLLGEVLAISGATTVLVAGTGLASAYLDMSDASAKAVDAGSRAGWLEADADYASARRWVTPLLLAGGGGVVLIGGGITIEWADRNARGARK